MEFQLQMVPMQLVSIFTICDEIAIFTESGGQCDLTNSNASFGNFGLFSKGVGDQTSKSIYRYTGEAKTSAALGGDTIVVSGIGNQRPYDGQLFSSVNSLTLSVVLKLLILVRDIVHHQD